MWSREHGPCLWGKKEISLPENNIDPHFSLHTNSVSTVLFFLVNFKMCMGKMASGDVTTRQLAVEEIKNMSNGSRERALRSQNCSRVCSLISTSPWPSCLSYKKKSKYVNPVHPSNTSILMKLTLNSIMSDAPPPPPPPPPLNPTPTPPHEMYHILQEQNR